MSDSCGTSSADQAAPTVGQRIKQQRQVKGISLTRLAELSGISKGYMHDLENGQAARPSAEVLYCIALELDTTVGFLLGKRRNLLEEKNGEETDIIPPSLEQFGKEDCIPLEDMRQLACIKYRNEQPKSVEDWRYLYETIKRVVR